MRGTISYEAIIQNDTFIAFATLPNGRKIRCSVPLSPIRKQVHAFLNNRVGWGWNDVKKFSKKAVKKIASKQALEKIQKVIDNPAFIAAAEAAGQAYPPAGVAWTTIKTANNIAKAVQAKNPQAIATVAQTVAEAQSGNPEAAKLAIALKVANASLKADMSKKAISLVQAAKSSAPAVAAPALAKLAEVKALAQSGDARADKFFGMAKQAYSNNAGLWGSSSKRGYTPSELWG